MNRNAAGTFNNNNVGPAKRPKLEWRRRPQGENIGNGGSTQRPNNLIDKKLITPDTPCTITNPTRMPESTWGYTSGEGRALPAPQ